MEELTDTVRCTVACPRLKTVRFCTIGTQDTKQGRINGYPVADGWAGAVVQKLLGIKKCYGMD